MTFEDAVEHFKSKYGNHTKAAVAIGWDTRKYRDVRNGRNNKSDARRLLVALAKIDMQSGDDAA